MQMENNIITSKLKTMGRDIEDVLSENEDLKKQVEDLSKKFGELTNQYNELFKKNKENEEFLAMLPDHIKKGSIDKDKTKSLRFKMVTVLFSEVHGFKKLADNEDAEALIDELDQFYIHFDAVVKRHNIEKINSIGDTYICAGGIPKKNRTNPIEVILAALEMQQYLKNLMTETKWQNKNIWDISCGIHTGPVVASIVGKKKISYEIKGDTVNMASRIESSSEAGKIIISAMTHEFVQEYFRCEYFGKMPIKYMGDILMYNVKGFRPEYSVDGDGIIPNDKFRTKFQLIKYDDLEEFMLDKLERELPKYLFYHNLKHTIDVCIQVEIIGRGENITDEELLLLKTAALFHDAGHIIQSKNHEFYSTEIAKEILPGYGYDDTQLEVISSIIMATQLPPNPKTLLQQIICDADLDYLGRSDFVPVSDTLFKELKEQKIICELNDWNKLQVKFLTAHHFFTNTANRLREVNKQKQIERIKNLVV